jgi:hypothetical protein
MAKSRMRKKDDGGLLAVHGLVRESLERLWKGEKPPTLSEILVDFLNGSKLTPKSKERVERIIQLIRFQKGYKSQFNARVQLNDDLLADLYFNSYARCSFELSENLRKYRVIPQFDFAEFGPMLSFVSARSDGGSPEKQAETSAVMCALQLAERDQLENVCKCSCGVFFVAGRIDQSYCSVTCRVKAHQSSDEFKARRRKADRERYRLHRDGKVKEVRGRKHGT